MPRRAVAFLASLALTALVIPAPADAQTAAVVDFEGLAPGTRVDSVEAHSLEGSFGPILVNGSRPSFPADNTAIIFDSSNPPGIDFDLGTPNESFGGPGIGGAGTVGGANPNGVPLGNILIVAEDLVDGDGDGLVDIPNDSNEPGAALEFDFSALGAVTVVSVTVLDVEIDQGELPASISLYDASDALIGFFDIGSIGNNGVRVIETGAEGLGTPGVARMEVMLNGSGAIDDIELLVDEPGDDTPPEVWCHLKRLCWYPLYKVLYHATDDSGEVEIEAVIDIGCGEIPVQDHQLVLALFKPWKCVSFWWCNLLVIKSGTVTLRVTATDPAGNQTVCECALFGGGGD